MTAELASCPSDVWWAQGQRATLGQLQVALDNRPALRFYSDAGFAETYRYFYLSCETPADLKSHGAIPGAQERRQ